jgi:hypothetical protein
VKPRRNCHARVTFPVRNSHGELKGPPNPRDRRLADSDLPGQLPGAPVRRPCRYRLERRAHKFPRLARRSVFGARLSAENPKAHPTGAPRSAGAPTVSRQRYEMESGVVATCETRAKPLRREFRAHVRKKEGRVKKLTIRGARRACKRAWTGHALFRLHRFDESKKRMRQLARAPSDPT